MKVVCAQCLREGLSDFDSPTEATVYCERHQLSLKSAMAWQPFTGIRLLVVVAAGDQVLFDYLRRACSGMADVAVIMERRHGERRSAESAVSTDRRGQDRRQLINDAEAPWYRYLRFGGGWVEERSREMAP